MQALDLWRNRLLEDITSDSEEFIDTIDQFYLAT